MKIKMSQHRTQEDLLDAKRATNGCIISFDKKFFMYKELDNHPLQMQTLMRKFFNWIDVETTNYDDKGTIVAAFVYYVKREDEAKTKHLYPDWKKNRVMTENLTLINDMNKFMKENPEPRMSYEVDLKKLTMFINDKVNKKEATIAVGRVPDNDETTFGGKATIRMDRGRPKAFSRLTQRRDENEHDQ